MMVCGNIQPPQQGGGTTIVWTRGSPWGSNPRVPHTLGAASLRIKFKIFSKP